MAFEHRNGDAPTAEKETVRLHGLAPHDSAAEPARGSAGVVEAERFVVRDAGGRVRAEWGLLGPDGVVGLTLHDAATRPCVSLVLGPDGWPTFWIWDQAGRSRLQLHVDEGLSPGEGSHTRLRFVGGATCAAMELTIGELDGPTLTFRNQEGVVLRQTSVEKGFAT